MKGSWLLTGIVLLSGYAALADAADVEPMRPSDAAAVRGAADGLARCAGVYRGAAELMRRSGRAEAAAYADSVGTGALFAAYLLLTSPAALEAKVLGSLDPNVHIEALAWGSARNFVMLEEQAESGTAAALRACTATSSMQSSVLRGALPVLATGVTQSVQ
jgi:hypothetical protein